MSRAKHIDFLQAGTLSKLITGYLTQNPELQDFYKTFPSKKGLLKKAKQRTQDFQSRKDLVTELRKQNSSLGFSTKQEQHISLLEKEHSGCITTGHQLNLFTGPIYIFYKILQVIKLCDELNQDQKEIHFVPIFWMASEDHDFEEIQFFWHQNKRLVWQNTELSGAVGRFSTNRMQTLYKEFSQLLPKNEKGKFLLDLFQSSYLEHETLSCANRFLIDQLFKEYGLLILDADAKSLKSKMIPHFKKEILEQDSYQIVSETNQKLQKIGHKIQVNPREINLFYLSENSRERIVKSNQGFGVHNTDFVWKEEELLQEIEKFPERFSPNALLRPLYQEHILPNVAYIGGNGEIAYWLQLRNLFEKNSVSFPILIPRNSFLVKSEKNASKQDKLQWRDEDLFLPKHEIEKKLLKEYSNLSIDFDGYRSRLEKMFGEIEEKAVETDFTFLQMVRAQQKKQMNGIDKMEKRMIRAEKKKHENWLQRFDVLYESYFPNGNFQERQTNFSDFFLLYDKNFISEIYKQIHPLQFQWNIVSCSNSCEKEL